MEYDVCGLRENFDPRAWYAWWRNAIGAARAMSRFAKGNGANYNKMDQQLVLSSDDEDDKDKGSRGRSPSSRATPEPDSKRQQQHLSPPSPDDRTLGGWLAGLVAKGERTASSSSSSPMSISDALNKTKAATEAETEKAREGDATPRAQTTARAPQPRNTRED